MKNEEFYKREIIDFALDGYSFGLSNNNLIQCNPKNCEICDFYYRKIDCNMSRFEWAEAEYIEPKDDSFRINREDIVYYISSNGGISSFKFSNDKLNKELVNYGNACKDKAYMERRAQEIKLYNLLSNFAYKVNEGWEPDWDDKNEYKYYIVYDNLNKGWCDSTTIWGSILGMVYFKTAELAQRAIDEIVIPFTEKE